MMAFSRRQRWGLTRCVFVALCLVSSPALAQLTNDTVPAERTVPRKEQIEGEMNSRFHLGPVRLLPQIQIIGPTYDNNVLGAAGRRAEGLGLVCHRVRWPGNPDSLRQEGVLARHGAAAVHLVRPPRRTPPVGRDLRGSALRILQSPVPRGGLQEPALADVPEQRNPDAGSRQTTRMGPSRSRSTSADPGRCTAMRNTSATSTSPSAAAPPVIGGVLSLLDRNEAAVRGGVRYKLTSYFSIGLGGEGTRTEFPEDPRRGNNETAAALVSVHYDQPRLFVNFSGGYRIGSPDRRLPISGVFDVHGLRLHHLRAHPQSGPQRLRAADHQLRAVSGQPLLLHVRSGEGV